MRNAKPMSGCDTLPHPDIGFAFLTPHCGSGYGFEAAQAYLERARGLPDITSVLAITSPDNTPSIRLLEKLGFTFDRLVSVREGEAEVKLFARPVTGHS